jgi:DNA-binding LytR/AlgR family response regulator
MNLNCIIIDDEPMARRVLEEYVEDIDFLHLSGNIDNPLKAASILDAEPIQLIFLDINMPKINGIDFLKSNVSLPMVILTTAYTEFALESYELDVLDYLVKPISFERFFKACIKAKDYYGFRNQGSEVSKLDSDYFFVKSDGKMEKVFYREVYYIESMMNYVILHLESKKMIVYLTLKSILAQLPSSIFLKVHKSFIVNISKITTIEGNLIKMGNRQVPISQNSYEQVIKEITNNKLLKR